MARSSAGEEGEGEGKRVGRAERGMGTGVADVGADAAADDGRWRRRRRRRRAVRREVMDRWVKGFMVVVVVVVAVN